MRIEVEDLTECLIHPRYDDFGCPVRGLHLTDADRDHCLRCGPAVVPAGPWTSIEDNDPPGLLMRRGIEKWPHTRWLDPEGRVHRDDAPAIESDLLTAWVSHGQLHRNDGPALTTDLGLQVWFLDGLVHRDDAPAIIDGDRVEYWHFGERHRIDGPAIYDAHRHWWYLHDRAVGSTDVWAAWVADQTDIAVDNDDAIAMVTFEPEDRDPADPFPPIDPVLAALALAMHPNQ